MQVKCPKCQNMFSIDEGSNGVDTIPEFSTKKLYVSSEIGLRMRSNPEIKDGNIIITIDFGKEVSVIQEQDKWFKVKADDKEGWVSRFYLSEELLKKESESKEKYKEGLIVDSVPQFKLCDPNYANSPSTISVRKIINDEFGGGANGYDLQCTEYVQYKIKQLGISIKWPSERPRHGGRWADIFRRHGLYKVLVEPKIGCAMSFTAGLRDVNIGHVAFVEKINGDGSIKISEANWPPPGKYFERVLTKAQWKEKYGGQFIDFT